MSDEKDRALIGWREWIALPELGVDWVKAKVDTGARTSSLHAWNIREFERDGHAWVRFVLHPEQRDDSYEIEVEAPLCERRHVRPSTGKRQLRPVIETSVVVHGQRFTTEITLASRDAMGFRMLLGRQALRERFLVDSAQSFVGGKRPKSKAPAKRRTQDER